MRLSRVELVGLARQRRNMAEHHVVDNISKVCLRRIAFGMLSRGVQVHRQLPQVCPDLRERHLSRMFEGGGGSIRPDLDGAHIVI
jgi:hypothetical protein